MEYAKFREEEKKGAFLRDFKSSRLRQTTGIAWGKVDEGTAQGTVGTETQLLNLLGLGGGWGMGAGWTCRDGHGIEPTMLSKAGQLLSTTRKVGGKGEKDDYLGSAFTRLDKQPQDNYYCPYCSLWTQGSHPNHGYWGSGGEAQRSNSEWDTKEQGRSGGPKLSWKAISGPEPFIWAWRWQGVASSPLSGLPLVLLFAWNRG